MARLTAVMAAALAAGFTASSNKSGNASSSGTPPGEIPPVPMKITWIHAPKTGSSFAVPVFEVSCGECRAKWRGQKLGSDPGRWFKERYPTERCCTKYSGIWHPHIGHDPLPADQPELTPLVVMMLRAPHRRLVSQYMYSFADKNLHVGRHGISDFDGEDIAALRAASRDTRISVGDRVAVFAAFPGIAHCQTKMILGYKCYARVEVTSQMVERAIAAMERFAFVGDTDQWVLSMCVFARKFGRPDLQGFHLNSRPTSGGKGAPKYSKVLAARQEYVDWADGALFAAASARLGREAVSYGCQTSAASGGDAIRASVAR